MRINETLLYTYIYIVPTSEESEQTRQRDREKESAEVGGVRWEIEMNEINKEGRKKRRGRERKGEGRSGTQLARARRI